jgi:hypothetical protein
MPVPYLRALRAFHLEIRRAQDSVVVMVTESAQLSATVLAAVLAWTPQYAALSLQSNPSSVSRSTSEC